MQLLQQQHTDHVHSGDGGLTVHADDPELNAKMELAAKILNLKGHYIAPKLSEQVLLLLH